MIHTTHPSLRTRSHRSGFTLVEMAVVVTLIGILMTLGLMTATSVMENSRRATTKERQDYVRDALLVFFTNNHRFPCADDGSAARNGVEKCPTALGTVPYQTLGIGRDKVIDGYGNFITYRLDTGNGWHLLATFPPSPAPCTPPPMALAVYSTPTAPPASATKAIVVLISHGPNGKGAWNQGLSQNTLPTATGELGNTRLNPTVPGGYRAYSYSDVAAAPFDDVVQSFGVTDLQILMTKMTRPNICN